MNRPSIERRAQVRAAPVEGNGIRETARLTGVRKPTILRFIEDPGAVCARCQNQHAPDLPGPADPVQ